MNPFLRIIILFIALVVVQLNGVSQQDSAKVAFAEQGLKVYYSSQSTLDYVSNTYNQTPISFKIQNNKMLHEFSKEVIDAYVADSFDFDTIDNFFKDYLDANIIEEVNEIGREDHFNTSDDENPFFTRAPNGPCVNMDFEEGSLNGWDMYEGVTNTSPAEMVGATQIGAPGAHHTIMTPGADPLVGISTTNPNGGNFSLRLGDGAGTGARAASIQQTFLVDANNAVFTYSYAVVLEDPSGHTLGEKPFFKVNLYDQSGAIIPCGEYQVVAGSGLDASWTNYGAGWYRDWQTVFAPLDAYIGQNVTIEFISGDCDQSGHYGYAYVDAECSPTEIIPPGTLICDGSPVTLSAPAGATSYLWNDGSTGQSITTSTPGSYSVEVTPVQGATCSVTMTGTVGGSIGAPIADFSAVPTSVCVGENIDFTDLSTATNGAVVDYWDYSFGDGSVNAATADAVHSYTSEGSYDVQFIAGVLVPGQGGCYDTIVQTVDVNGSPTAAFSASNSCLGTATQFTDESTTNAGVITGWEWDFTSDGTVDNTQQNSSGIMGADGLYTATLVVTSGGSCTDTVSQSFYVHPIPTAEFEWTDVCENEAIDFTDLSTVSSGTISTYQWDFGDLVGSSNLQNTSYTYGGSGQYNVVLTITSDSGCVDSQIYGVEVYDNPIAGFTFNDACENTPVTFADVSNTNGATLSSINWDFDNNGTIDYTGSSTDYTYSLANSYQVTMIVETQDGCLDSITEVIQVFPTPVASFSGQNVCVGNVVNFTNNSNVSSGSITNQFWDFVNGNSSNGTNPSETFIAEGIYNVSLQVESDNGCVNTVTEPIEIYPIPNAQFLTADVCDGTTVNFTDFSNVSNTFTSNTITSWDWDFGTTPATGTTGQFANTMYTAPGTYTVTLDVATNNSCASSYAYDVTISPNPVVSFASPNPDGCTEWCPTINNTSTISSGVNNSYLWNLGDGTASIDENPDHCYTNNTLQNVSYDVSLTVTSDNGCTTTLTETDFITVYPEPVAEFSHEPLEGDVYNSTIDFINESSLADFNDWSFADLGTSTDIHPSFTFPDQDSGVYEVCLNVETIYGCTSSICYDVEIKGYANIFVPNAFTPDGDGLNDTFLPSVFGFAEDDYELMIFDRWGILIFNSTDKYQEWDGTYKGQPCMVDAYIWKIQAVDKYTGEKSTFRGHINLLR